MTDRGQPAPESGGYSPGSPAPGRRGLAGHRDRGVRRTESSGAHYPAAVASWRRLLRRLRSLRRPRVASRANLVWLVLFPLFLGFAGFLVVRLWEAGTRAALYTTEGQTIEIITDPTQPGFEALLDPTPTLLLAHTDDGALIGITAMTRTSVDAGGHMVLIGPLLFVRSEAGSDEGRFLSEVFDTEGLDGLRRAVGAMFGFGFGSAVEWSTEDLAAAMGQAAPLPLNLADNLTRQASSGEETVWIEGGPVQLDGPTAAAVYNFVNPADVEVNRQERQRGLWQAWLAKVGSADDPAALADVGDQRLTSYLLPLARGDVAVEILPTRLVAFDENDPFYVLEEEDLAWLALQADAMVPVPVPPSGESWPSIRLLDGVGDPDGFSEALDALFDIKMQVVIVGNAVEFGVERSSVVYHATDDETAAAAVSSALGLESQLSEEAGQPGVITVIVGEDWQIP